MPPEPSSSPLPPPPSSLLSPPPFSLPSPPLPPSLLPSHRHTTHRHTRTPDARNTQTFFQSVTSGSQPLVHQPFRSCCTILVLANQQMFSPQFSFILECWAHEELAWRPSRPSSAGVLKWLATVAFVHASAHTSSGAISLPACRRTCENVTRGFLNRNGTLISQAVAEVGAFSHSRSGGRAVFLCQRRVGLDHEDLQLFLPTDAQILSTLTTMAPRCGVPLHCRGLTEFCVERGAYHGVCGQFGVAWNHTLDMHKGVSTLIPSSLVCVSFLLLNLSVASVTGPFHQSGSSAVGSNDEAPVLDRGDFTLDVCGSVEGVRPVHRGERWVASTRARDVDAKIAGPQIVGNVSGKLTIGRGSVCRRDAAPADAGDFWEICKGHGERVRETVSVDHCGDDGVLHTASRFSVRNCNVFRVFNTSLWRVSNFCRGLWFQVHR